MRRMKSLVLAALVVAAVSLVQAGGGDKSKKDAERIIGTWALVSGEKSGEKAPENFVREFRLTFSAQGKMHVKLEDKDVDGTYKLDPAKKPKEIDISVDDKNFLGIYAFDGKNMKLCVSPDDRPTEFATQAGVKSMLLILKRHKD
jgi:uncharacterized protein (TIGR03067 family)